MSMFRSFQAVKPACRLCLQQQQQTFATSALRLASAQSDSGSLYSILERTVATKPDRTADGSNSAAFQEQRGVSYAIDISLNTHQPIFWQLQRMRKLGRSPSDRSKYNCRP